jgi:hypothetical protein
MLHGCHALRSQKFVSEFVSGAQFLITFNITDNLLLDIYHATPTLNSHDLLYLDLASRNVVKDPVTGVLKIGFMTHGPDAFPEDFAMRGKLGFQPIRWMVSEKFR